MQAIAYKMSNPEADETTCAREAAIAVSTLNGHLEWQRWVPLIERAFNSGKMALLKREFDARTGDYLVTDS